MKLYSGDILFNQVSNLEKKKIIDNTTYDYLKNELLPQDDTKIWRYAVLNAYSNIYVGILTNDKIKEYYFENIENTNNVIVSYMVIHKIWDHPFRYIELIDTFISENNLAIKMIKAYKKQYRKPVLPNHIIPTSATFWQKYLREEFKLTTQKEMEDFIQKYSIEGYVSWGHLYNIL